MKTAVRYYTKTGNTRRLAEAIGKAIGTEALPISVPVTEPVDILFLGNSYYAFSIDPEVRSFIQTLDKQKVGCIVNFGSAAMLNSTYKKKSRLKPTKSVSRWMNMSFTVRENLKAFTKADRMKTTSGLPLNLQKRL